MQDCSRCDECKGLGGGWQYGLEVATWEPMAGQWPANFDFRISSFGFYE